jgi:hypothetical protein
MPSSEHIDPAVPATNLGDISIIDGHDPMEIDLGHLKYVVVYHGGSTVQGVLILEEYRDLARQTNALHGSLDLLGARINRARRLFGAWRARDLIICRSTSIDGLLSIRPWLFRLVVGYTPAITGYVGREK